MIYLSENDRYLPSKKEHQVISFTSKVVIISIEISPVCLTVRVSGLCVVSEAIKRKDVLGPVPVCKYLESCMRKAKAIS